MAKDEMNKGREPEGRPQQGPRPEAAQPPLLTVGATPAPAAPAPDMKKAVGTALSQLGALQRNLDLTGKWGPEQKRRLQDVCDGLRKAQGT